MKFEDWWNQEPRLTQHRLIAELAWNEATEVVIPKGHALVPIDPTKEMIKATKSLIHLGAIHGDLVTAIFQVMTTAAQEDK